MRRAAPIAAIVVLLLGVGCSETPPELLAPPPPAGNPGPVPPRVLVANSLSWTLSSLDLSSGAMSMRAADAGAVPNRMTLLSDHSALLVTASGDNRVTIRSSRDLSPWAGIDVGVGSSPWTAVPTSLSTAVVTNWLSGDVRKLDLASGSAGPRIPTTPGPEGVVVIGARAFVACTNYEGASGTYGEGRLDVVDLNAGRVVASVPVGSNPQDVARDRAGRIHVLCTGTYGVGPEQGSVHVVDPVTLQAVSVVPLGQAPGRVCAGDGDVMWVAGFSGGLRRYDAATLQLLPDPTDPALLAANLSAVAWDAETGTAYVTNFASDLLMAVDGATLGVTDVWIVGDGPVDVLVLRVE